MFRKDLKKKSSPNTSTSSSVSTQVGGGSEPELLAAWLNIEAVPQLRATLLRKE